MEDLIQLIDVLIWPMTTLVLAMLFRSELRSLFRRVSSLKYKDMEANFRDLLDEIERDASQIIEDTVPEDVASPYRERFDRLMQLAEFSPRAAILEVWIEIESELVKLSQRANIELPPRRHVNRLAEEMVKADLLPNEILALLKNLRNLRNEAVHLPDFVIDDEGMRYLNVAIAIANRIQLSMTGETVVSW